MRWMLLLLTLLHAALAFTGYTPESFPNSMQQPQLCSQEVPGLLCDPERLLNRGGNLTANYHRLNQKLAFIRYNTTCKCGANDSVLGSCLNGGWGFTVSIAVVDSMILEENQHGRDSILRAAETFSERLRRRLPRGNCDDDAFILLAVRDNAAWTSVGKVTERYLTSELVNMITLRAESYFKQGAYTEGLMYMLNSYNTILTGQKYETSDDGTWVWPIPKWAVIVIAVVVLLVLLAVVVLSIWCCIRCCRTDNRGHYSTVTQRGSRL